jgi:hypothetical protein
MGGVRSGGVINRRHVVLAHAVAEYRELGQKRIDLLHVGGAQLHAARPQVFEQVRLAARAGDRDDVQALREQPGQGDLRGRCALPRRLALQPLDERHVERHELP